MAIGSNPSNGDSQVFSYNSESNEIRTFTVPADGIYKLEVWGARGGAGGNWGGTAGGNGGHSIGYKKLKAGDVLYICLGGKGSSNHGFGADGGYNGGGYGRLAEPGNSETTHRQVGGGGGATHIATKLRGTDGQLKRYKNYQEDVLIVAGGGAGSGGSSGAGGDGGGNTGGGGNSSYGAHGGTQTAIGSGGRVQTGEEAAFGKGSGAETMAYGNGGGGGGWYGGVSGSGGSGGGSGYIGGVPSITVGSESYNSMTTRGGNTEYANGRAKITFESKGVLFYFNEKEVTDLVYNGTNITSLTFNGNKIF